MRILLDSHAFVWFVLGDPKCSPNARQLIEADDAHVFVSAVSAWELSTKIGKWPNAAPIVRDFESIIAQRDFTALSISVEHGRIAGLLAATHKDPFDRMLAAQSRIEALPLVTADRRLAGFGIETIW